MQLSTLAIIASTLSAVSAAITTVDSADLVSAPYFRNESVIADPTVTEIESTTITITSCSDDKCSEKPVVTGLTTVTENETIYTTYCPLTDYTPSSSAEWTPSPEHPPVSEGEHHPPANGTWVPPPGHSTKTEIESTTITITSCSDNKCSEKPVVTGLTTVTENETVYTTYCPLTDYTPGPSAEWTPSPEHPPSSEHPEGPAPTGTTAWVVPPVASTGRTIAGPSTEEPQPSVSEFENAAGVLAAPIVAGLVGVLANLL